jgi:antitoxin YefM
MAHVTYTDLRGNLKKFLDEVCDSHAPLVVTRQNGRNVIIVSEQDYEGLAETAYLLRSPNNTARLLASIKAADDGDVSAHEPTGSTAP